MQYDIWSIPYWQLHVKLRAWESQLSGSSTEDWSSGTDGGSGRDHVYLLRRRGRSSAERREGSNSHKYADSSTCLHAKLIMETCNVPFCRDLRNNYRNIRKTFQVFWLCVCVFVALREVCFWLVDKPMPDYWPVNELISHSHFFLLLFQLSNSIKFILHQFTTNYVWHFTKKK